VPNIDWGNNPERLFDQTKNHYVPYIIEKVISETYSHYIGDPLSIKCHLSVEQLQKLRKKGWDIGNHTWQHMTLSTLLQEQVIDSIEHNETFLKENGLAPIPWLSYPNGLVKHVNPFVKAWLDAHPHVSGIFAGGGVNYCFSRTEWLRMPIGYHNADQFRKYIDHSVIATNLALSGKIHPPNI
jgi:peptidoglycan/xylan/chitin deacetylase (PgdA/CDA1 family)